MNQFPIHWAALILGEPIKAGPLELFPIRMKDYPEWMACKPTLQLRLGELPAEYAVLPWQDALFRMDVDNINNNTAGGHLFFWLRLLGLATQGAFAPGEESVQFVADGRGTKRLKCIRILYGGEWVDIDHKLASRLRAVIAGQNGCELPDEADNPELLEAQRIMEQKDKARLDHDFLQTLDAVALHSGVRVRDLMEWPVWEFEKRMQSISLAFGHTVNGIVSPFCGGSEGNPYPAWFAPRAKELSRLFRSEASLLGQLGKVGDVRK